MRIKHVWYAALLLAAGLCAGLSTPAAAQLFGTNAAAGATSARQAAPGKPMVLKSATTHRSRSTRRSRTRKTTRRTGELPKRRPVAQSAARSETDKVRSDEAKTREAKTGEMKTETVTAAPAWPAISPSVANARAELGGGTADARTVFDASPATASAIAAPAAQPAGSSATTAAPPAPHATPPVESAAATVAPAAAAAASAATEAPVRLMAAVVPAEQTAGAGDSAWSRTSLIGKIFVAFGGLLMLASAARLYIG